MTERPARLLAAALLCLSLLAQAAEGQETTWQGFMVAGESAAKGGNMVAARVAYEAALEAAADFPGQDPRLGLTLNALAKAHLRSGEPDLAELLLQRAIGIWESAPELGALHLATALEALGQLYVNQDRSGEAAAPLGRALALREENLPAGHPALRRSRAALTALASPDAHAATAATETAALLSAPDVEDPSQSGVAMLAPVVPRESAGAGFAVHLASLKSPERAAQEWARLQQSFPGLLGDMTLKVEQVDLGDRGIFQRILVVPFPNKATALDMCVQLLAARQFCQVVPLKDPA